MSAPPVFEMRGIRKEYFGTTVLKDVDLALQAGEIHALLGENGAGKSTLMNILFGMPVIHSTGGFQGEVLVNGNPVHIASPAHAMDAGIGMVHQEFMLIPGFAIFENIKLNRENLKKSVLGRILGSNFDRLDIPAMRSDSQRSLKEIELAVDDDLRVGDLPVGHMQFVEIAREVDKEGIRVLVFDEPTAVLAESEADRLLSVMTHLAEQGIAILFITHRLDEVMRVADTVTILRDGERVVSCAKEETSIEDIAEKMVGRALGGKPAELAAAVRPDETETRRPILTIRNLQVAMPGEMVRGVDLDLHVGEILGIGGLAGQGKIGIANGLMGLYPSRGRVEIEDRPLLLNTPREALRERLGFVSEDRRGVGLLLDESVEMNIAIPAVEVRGRFLRAKPLRSLAWIDRRQVRLYATDMIERLDIRTTGPTQPVRRLSGGNQQKVCLARALVLEPRILLVSEPTRGIDVGAKQLILEWLVRLNREEGLTILMTSSELGELRSICHRIAIVTEGRVAGILTPDAPDVKFGLLMSGEAA